MAESLVVVSKVKQYIKSKAGFNTSGETVEVLTEQIKKLCDKGIESAKADGRKTVMARDFNLPF